MAAEHVETVDGPTTPVWPGFEHIDTIVMFGDSYTAVGYDYINGPHPTKENPIGETLPGQTYAEGLNWCGHLLRDWVKTDKHQPLVYNYAQGGDTVAGVEGQIARGFLKRVGQRPDWAPWTSERSLFLTWIGINDLAYRVDPKKQLQRLFNMQEKLYAVGARNFVFVDAPPVVRFPCYRSYGGDTEAAMDKFTVWNQELRSQAQAFREGHPGVTTFICSSHDIFTDILDDPEQYGFTDNDIENGYSKAWLDQLHPTTAIHGVVACKIAELLYSLPPSAKNTLDS